MDRSRLPGYVLGFALGGFFDGILLHQILQWHHLLSAVGPADLRIQVAADGLFHLLMYMLAGLGLWRLWTAGRRDRLPPAKAFCGQLLIGFGTWHLVDSIASHWVLGIHRIRMDSEHRLFWDLLWFAGFGLLPCLLGWWLGRNAGTGRARPAMAAMTAILVVGAGTQALRPAGEARFTTVLFAPGMNQDRVMAALFSLDARPVWRDASGQVVVIETASLDAPHRLFGHGAILIGGSGLPAGCFGNLKI